MNKLLYTLSILGGIFVALYITYDGTGDLGEKYLSIGNHTIFIGYFYNGEQKNGRTFRKIM